MNAPCKNCPDRTPDCHSTCKDYKDYMIENEKIKAERRKHSRETDDFFATSEWHRAWIRHQRKRRHGSTKRR